MTDFNFSPLLFFQVIAVFSYLRFCGLFIWGWSALRICPQISCSFSISTKFRKVTVPNFYGCSSRLVNGSCCWGGIGDVRSGFMNFIQNSELSFRSLLVRQFSGKFNVQRCLSPGNWIGNFRVNYESWFFVTRVTIVATCVLLCPAQTFLNF